MRHARGGFGVALAGTFLLASWGCDGGGKPTVSTSNTEAQVSGKVTLRGKALAKGEVTFDPANHQRNVPPHTAKINPDGTYQVTTLIGRNSVSVRGPEIDKDKKLGYAVQAFEVQNGANTLDIDLPLKKP